MNFEIHGYTISGDVIGEDIYNWDDADLSGNDPFILTDVPVVGYADVNTLENWDLYGLPLVKDYQEQQRGIRLLGYEETWVLMSNAEKDIVLRYNAHPESETSPVGTERLTYLTDVQFMSDEDARMFLVTKWHDFWTEFTAAGKQRWEDAVKMVLEHLSFSDATKLFELVSDLITAYLTAGRLGLDFGDTEDGLMDYILNTNGYSGTGLGNEADPLTLLKSDWTTFADDLKDVFVDSRFWDQIEAYL